MGTLRWYKRDPDRAINGMAMLTLEERGAYNGILDLLYSRDGDVPDDDKLIGNVLRINPRTWRAMKQRLIAHGKLWITGGKVHAKRVEITLKEARKESEEQSKRARNGWENRKNRNDNNDTLMPHGNASRIKSKIEDTDSVSVTDTESLIVKSLPLAETVGKKINGFHNGSNGSALKQQQADQFVQQRCAEALGNDGWMVVFAAEDETAPDHSRAVSLMLKTSKRLKLGWISPEEKRRRAQA